MLLIVPPRRRRRVVPVHTWALGRHPADTAEPHVRTVPVGPRSGGEAELDGLPYVDSEGKFHTSIVASGGGEQRQGIGRRHGGRGGGER